jgi:hypothetical protein
MKKPIKFISTILFITLLCACNLPRNGTILPTPSTVATTALPTLPALTSTQVPSPTSRLPSFTPTITPTLIPMPPSLTTTKAITATPSITPIPQPGTIAGSISGYPYGSLPALAIVAYGQNPPNYYSYIITAPGSTTFSMSTDYLIPGPFQVVAYDASGNSGGCPGFVTVISNQTVTCTISDWVSSYRSKPSNVPNP